MNNEKELFKNWVQEYLEDYVRPSCKPSAAEHYSDNLLKHAVPALGEIPLDEITAPVLQKFLNREAESGNLRTGGPLSAKSLRNLRTAISGCLSMAVALGKISSNPVPNTVIRRAPRPVMETMSQEELEILTEFLATDYHLMNFGVILAARLGLRRGEICALRWRDYDARSGYLSIRNTVKRLPTHREDGPRTEMVFGPAKTEAAKRSLALPPDMTELLALQAERFEGFFDCAPGPDDFIFFSSCGGMIDPDHLTQYFSDVLDELKLPHVKLHALRHTFASRAVARGIDIETVSGLLGHTDVTTTTHYYLHPRQEAMNKALWTMSSASGEPPKKLPPVYRGKPVSRKHLRRNSFDKEAIA